ncbi:MAG: glycosyltransferase [Bryobacteraceae bacterium]
MRNRPAPRISVVMPTYERPRELRLCLEGFRNQTVAPEEFEVIVVDDGSLTDLEPIVADVPGLRIEFRKSPHGGPSVARNMALGLASAPMLLFWDDDLRPLPALIEYCLEFHRSQPATNDAALVYFTDDPSRTASGFEQWAFGRLYPFPQAPGIYDWSYFWSGSVTCKRALLADHAFNPQYGCIEDAEMALRLAEAGGLRVHFEPRPGGLFTRRLTFDGVLRRQRQMAYYRFRLAGDCGGRIGYAHPVYARPEEYVLEDSVPLLTAKALADLGGSVRSAAASSLWTAAENHALATGWLAARRGLPPEALLVP